MRAETWIKTLNARLLAEPNWAIKAGYLTTLIAASLALAGFLILRVTFSFLGNMLLQTAKNVVIESPKAEPVDDDRGYKGAQFYEGYDPSGPEGPGYYVDGNRVG